MYHVYEIRYRGIARYIGMSKNVGRRQKDHNSLYRNGYSKQIYNWLREHGHTGELTLIVTHSFKKKIDCKRMEMLIILQDYFGKKNLQQKVPSIGR